MNQLTDERPADCNCSRWYEDGQHREWCKHALAGGFTFGIGIDIDGNRYRQTGRYPSPSYGDCAAVANAVLDFLNGHLGTKFVAVEAFDEGELKHTCGGCGGELQIVRPGKYQCVSCRA